MKLNSNRNNSLLRNGIVAVIVGIIFQGVSAQTIVTTTATYNGHIGDYPVVMRLQATRANDTLYGSYYYMRSGRSQTITLNGLLKHPTVLEEKAIVNKAGKYTPEITGFFSITAPLTATIELKGTWKNANAGKKLPVRLQLLTRVENAPLAYDYELVTRNEKVINLSQVEQMMKKVTALKIIKEGKIVQTIAGLNEFTGEQPAVELEDINFDGYFDIKVPISYPDRTKYDGSFLYFIYQPATQKFIKHQQLNDLEYLFFDPVKKEVYRYDEGPEGFVVKCYKWRSNEVYLHRTEKMND